MSRPYVNVLSDNIINELNAHLESMMPKFQSLTGVIGITLNGGLSRGYADHLSEIDITFYLDHEGGLKWKEDKSPIPLGIVKFDGVLYDIKTIDYEEESRRKYGDVELWDLSYAKVLFDTDNKIATLFKKKLSTKPDISDANDMIWEAYWNYKLAGDIWINRGDVLQGHFMLNEAIKPLIKALFIANKEYTPHEKWLVHMSATLNWKPLDWEERLMKAMNIESLTINALVNRQRAIESLCKDIGDYIKKENYPEFNLECHQKSFYDLVKEFVQRETISVDEWVQKSSLFALNMDPLHMITEIHEGEIKLNKEKLLSITENDLYSWHYQIVQNVINDLGIF